MTMDSQPLRISHESQEDLLFVTVEGLVEIPYLTRYVTSHQVVWKKYPGILWDLRDIDPSRITSDDVLNLHHSFAEIAHLRSGGRTALLVSTDLELIAKIAVALCETHHTPIELKTFLDENEAIGWLKAT